jgi:hypothetical protein
MNTPRSLILLSLLALNFAACSSPEAIQRREARRAKEDAEWQEEHRKYGEEKFQFFLEEYAHRLGKAKSELTPAEYAEARHDWEADYYHGWSHNW